ncbi:MAG: NAD-dependent epimerase/dehydratase family protein [Candidatus Rokubacteria bacterium]|nr:NAD-dependent epimerase/dehydratase family protein [Candidatus Rokubacteria bacterium]
MSTYLVTGGAGFLGSALTRRLARAGHRVRVLDDLTRGSATRLEDVKGDIELLTGDVRDPETVARAVQGVEAVCHLAFINGTEFFYTKPEAVLEVGVKGMVNVLDACRAHRVRELCLVSSSEVYQVPPAVPTDETAPLSIPDPLNPRYSYAAGKMISELMAVNYGRTGFDRVLIARPHNVYGPDMGTEHVIPQFLLRMRERCEDPEDPVPFPIQGSGKETRAFTFIDDCVEGLMTLLARGAHLGIYHVGTTEELTIEAVAHLVAATFGRRIRVIPGEPRPGSAPRRCPDIRRLMALGYRPRVPFREGLALTAAWYREHGARAPASPPAALSRAAG